MRKNEDFSYTGYNRNLALRAKELRREMTPEEKHLWYDFLRTYPVRFYRQRVIDRCIVDFYCSKAKMSVELDGFQHSLEEIIDYDKERTDILNRYGIFVLRFSNKQIREDFDGVCECIDQTVKDRIHSAPTGCELTER